ncbi:nucleoside-diphosphate-sugar epimerase [Streptomyces sp. 3211.6]|uniref:NAD-dependent epimerase/dehydratase family protein n=1 Tax=Streptomyces sp. 3211.6 TaxID=1938845 RepID=UPI000CC6BD5C|nr:NAD-dependent epimerase/dehydratase family protein [Streptomyces sp. 3211.6]RKT06034.1 nucleoside-diphosphate-sugar epimerase [Streptomyces sp. 3211.6]
MRILVLGGGWFLGRAVIEGALARGWDVTAFNRGRSGCVPEGVETVRGDRTSDADLKRLAQAGLWDAVIDTSSGEMSPRTVLAAAEALRPAVGRWVHVSTVSVYWGWPHQPLTEESALLEAPADADESFGYTGADGSPTKYGFQKAGAEKAVCQTFGGDVVILRPGVILGPGEYVGRLPWWLRRAERGGAILAAAPSSRPIQPVDVRDVAAFALDQAARTGGGAFNIAHSAPISIEEFLAHCLAVTGGAGRVVWADPAELERHGVRQWTEMPLWRTASGVWSVDASRAVAAGLSCRPLTTTISDTWNWLKADGRPVAHPRASEHGIAADKEREILAALAC